MPNPQNLIPAKKGEVRNPNGRPKGSRNRSTIARKWLEAMEAHTNPITGQVEQLSQEDIITLAQLHKARKGDSAGYRNMMDSAYGSPDQNITTQNETKHNLSDVSTEDIAQMVSLINAIDNRADNGL